MIITASSITPPFSKVFPKRRKSLPAINNIARTITRLESELSCKLFIRSHRGVTLTPEGEALFKHVPLLVNSLTWEEKSFLKCEDSRRASFPSEPVKRPCAFFSWTASYHSTRPIPASISRSATAKRPIPLKPLSADKWKWRSFPLLSRLGRNTTMRHLSV